MAVFDLLQASRTWPQRRTVEPHQDRGLEGVAANALKAERLRVDQWREKEATQSAVKVAIHDFLYSDATGLPAGAYSDGEVTVRSDDIFRHVYRVYPTLPSPYYETAAA